MIPYNYKTIDVYHLGDGHYYGIATDVHGVVRNTDVSEKMCIGEDIDSIMTVQKYVGSRYVIVGLFEGFNASNMLGLVFFHTDIVLFCPFLMSSVIGSWIEGVDSCVEMDLYYDAKGKSII